MKRVAFWTAIAVSIAMGAGIAPVFAQSTFWIEIEEQPDIITTKQRAQFYGQRLGDVGAFLSRDGLNILVLGPYDQEMANIRLAQLMDTRLIPADSFVSNGSNYIRQIWPISSTTGTLVIESPIAAEETETFIDEDPEIEVAVVDPLPEPDTVFVEPAIEPVPVIVEDEPVDEVETVETVDEIDAVEPALDPETEPAGVSMTEADIAAAIDAVEPEVEVTEAEAAIEASAQDPATEADVEIAAIEPEVADVPTDADATAEEPDAGAAADVEPVVDPEVEVAATEPTADAEAIEADAEAIEPETELTPSDPEPSEPETIAVEPEPEDIAEPEPEIAATEPDPEPTIVEADAEVLADEPEVTEPTIEPDVEVAMVVEEPEPEAEPEILLEEDLPAAKALEKSWTRDEKKDVQIALTWTGDYEAGIDGAFGRGSRAAVSAFQERNYFEATGYLSRRQYALLMRNHNARIARLGFALTRDLDAGIEINLPSALVEFDRFEPPFVHYGPKPDSPVSVMLISQTGDRDAVKSLYDIMETFDFVPEEGYRVRKRDWFVLSGKDDSQVSYTYVRHEKGLVKGFTMIWTPEIDAEMKQVAVAMFESFNPIADYVLDETIGFGSEPDEEIDLVAGIDTPLPDLSVSGFFINAAGAVVTSNTVLDGCSRITVNDGTEMVVVAQDPALELAILAPKVEVEWPQYASFSDELPYFEENIAVSGYSYEGLLGAPTLSFGTYTGDTGFGGDPLEIRLTVEVEPGDAGGPVFDARGAVIGMQKLKTDSQGRLPAYVNFASKGANLTQALLDAGLDFTTSQDSANMAPEDLAVLAHDITALVSCWR